MTRAAVAASSEISAQAGAQLVARGGNAVDAVLGSALVSMCTDIGIMSPAGGALVAVWPPGEPPVVFDGCPEMPGRGNTSRKLGDGMWEVTFDYGGPARQRIGFGAVATPGAFAALSAAHRFGSLTWEAIMEPAISWVRKGFPLRGGAAEYLRYTHEAIYSWQDMTRELLHRSDGTPLANGDVVSIPDLADSLEQIATEGVQTLYGGPLGRRIAAGVQDGGGLLGIADLEAYRATELRAIEADLGDWRIATGPPPSIGGPCLVAMLHLLDTCPERELATRSIRWLIDAQHAVLGYRAGRLDGAVDALPEAAARLLDLAQIGEPSRLLSAPSTIHISGVDDTGLGCSLTASAGYGSGAMVPGTGIWLNNSLGEVDLHPQGLAGFAPGMRLSSNMAPTVARRGDGAVLAIGSPGASRITTAIAQTLWHHIFFGLPLEAAVEHPRLHVELFGETNKIAYEHGLPVEPVNGFELREFERRSMYFGGVQVARWSPSSGFKAVADTRRGGATAEI